MVIKMPVYVSKSQFKARALDYFRQIEKSGEGVIITDRGIPVLEIHPLNFLDECAPGKLRGTVLGYQDPFEPVGAHDWDVLK